MILISMFLKVAKAFYVFVPLALLSCLQHPLLNRHLNTSINYYTGEAGVVDDSIAREHLEFAISERDTLALMWLARVYSTGRMSFPKDSKRASSIARLVIDDVATRAETGEPEALFLMGTAYDESLGVTQDYDEAMRWYRRAADSGHILASHNIGNMYRDGRGVGQDPRRAAAWWLRAARAGDVIPALRLGEAYEAGRGVPQSHSIARYWYQRAAAAGNVTATTALERIKE